LRPTMSVVDFPSADQMRGWRCSELEQIRRCAPEVEMRAGASWNTGFTEAGDPQAYLIGPAPDYDCLLAVSRIGRLYVVEDGNGLVLGEGTRLEWLVERARRLLQRKKAGLIARVTIAWYAAREAFEEKIEPMLAEPVELLTHFAPQLAAFV
jgi:hypothetical protein